MKYPTVKFLGEECTVELPTYSNGRIAVKLVSSTGEPWCVASTNLPELPLGDNEVFIKDYSENEGILTALCTAGIVRVIDYIEVGPYKSPAAKCELLIKREGGEE
jgi:hypothetical protein